MQGNVVVVTGSARGIGFFTARRFLENGAKVVIADVNVADGENAVRQFSSERGEGRALFRRCDVTKKEEIDDLFKFAWSAFGRLGVVVNNAGLMDESQSGWESSVDVNIKGVVHGTRAAIKSMGKHCGKPGGTIINVSSGLATLQTPEIPIYSSTKSFVRHFSSLMGAPFHYDRTGVRVITVCPGRTDTFFHRVSRCDDEIPGIEDIHLRVMEKALLQSPTTVARGIVNLVSRAESGSTWMIRGDEEPYEIVFDVHRARRT